MVLFSLSFHTGFNVFYYFLIFVCFVVFCSQLFMQCLFVCFNFLTVFYTSYSWNISGLNKIILLNGAHKPFWLKMKKQLFPLAPIWSSWGFKTTQNQRWCYSGECWSLASCCICWPRTRRKGGRKVFFHVSNQVKWRTRKILSWFPTAMDIFEGNLYIFFSAFDVCAENRTWRGEKHISIVVESRYDTGFKAWCCIVFWVCW